MRLKLALIVNPIAGQGRAEKALPQVKRKLKEVFNLQIYRTQRVGDGILTAKRALNQDCQIIVAMGGDGTVFEVVNGIIGSKAILGVIPCGTGNVFAAEMGIPFNLFRACEVILRGSARNIDVGRACPPSPLTPGAGKRVNDRYFVLMAGVGFDAQIVQEVNPEVKRMLKDLAYILTGIKTLFTYKPTLMEIELDGEEKEKGYFVVVGNAKCYAGRYFSITTQASIEDGWLDICIFKKGDIASFVRYITGVLLRKHLAYSDVYYKRAKRVQITASVSTLVQADGELIGQTPMHFAILPHAVSVITP
ncbi:MAG: diacylglycerol kinase family protein [Actinomycetota bacterium]